MNVRMRLMAEILFWLILRVPPLFTAPLHHEQTGAAVQDNKLRLFLTVIY